MPEILTESFCERCGTRYTFESAAPRAARLKGIKVLSRGLKNFVMSDDTSMDEAMAAARSETDREVTTQQLDAFHKTFNFCMTCRQYTCGNCWNEAEGRCLTCAPHLGHEILPAPFPDLDPASGLAVAANGTNGHATLEEPEAAMAWPTSDLMRDAEDEALAVDAIAQDAPAETIEEVDVAARLAALGGAAAVGASADATDVAEPVAEEAVVDALDTADGTETLVDAAPSTPAAATPPSIAGPATIDQADVDGRAAAASAQTAAMFRRFRPGQNLDDEIAAYEREQEAAAHASDALGVAAAAALTTTGPEDHAPTEPDHDLAAAALAAAAAIGASQSSESAPAQPATPESAAPAEPEPIAASAAPREDVVPQPTWQIVAPEAPGTEGPPTEPAPPAPEPQWPSQVEWPSQRPAAGLPFMGRGAQPDAPLESLWAESAREVATAAARPTTGVQPCVSCGLSLSATARFCRRCGTRQG